MDGLVSRTAKKAIKTQRGILNLSTGSFIEFLPILQLFRQEYTPSTLPYHIIVPSLPGYTFSSGPPVDRNFTTHDIARVLDHLMRDLGFESGYIAQGGDIGSRIARILGVDYASCRGMINSNLFRRTVIANMFPAVHRKYTVL